MQISWTEDLAIGVDQIDNDHKDLLQFYNELAHAVESKAVWEDINDRMSFVCYYCIAHFGREEDLMDEIDYPDIAEHIQSHNALQAEFSHLFEIYSASRAIQDAERIVGFIGTWLTRHILQEDVAIGVHYRSRATMPAPIRTILQACL